MIRECIYISQFTNLFDYQSLIYMDFDKYETILKQTPSIYKEVHGE